MNKNDKLVLVKPTPGAAIVSAAYPSAKIASVAVKGDISKSNQQTWEELADISEAIAKQIAATADQINQTAMMVAAHGCDRISEYNIAINAANRDLNQFTDTFCSIRDKHIAKHGIITDSDDLAFCIHLFENYQQFIAHFNGTMSHTMILFTDFALQAKDRLMAKLAEEQATSVEVAPQEPQ